MKKTFITLALAACAMMLVSCGNYGDKQREAKQAEPAAAAKAAAAGVKAMTLGDVNDLNYAALIKDRCGFDRQCHAEVQGCQGHRGAGPAKVVL